jgi:hypothetical protein
MSDYMKIQARIWLASAYPRGYDEGEYKPKRKCSFHGMFECQGDVKYATFQRGKRFDFCAACIKIYEKTQTQNPKFTEELRRHEKDEV